MSEEIIRTGASLTYAAITAKGPVPTPISALPVTSPVYWRAVANSTAWFQRHVQWYSSQSPASE